MQDIKLQKLGKSLKMMKIFQKIMKDHVKTALLTHIIKVGYKVKKFWERFQEKFWKRLQEKKQF